MLGAIGAGLSIGSSIFSGISGYNSAKKAAAQRKKIAEMRAGEFERQADLTQEQGVEMQQQAMDQLARRRSMIEGMYSKSGLMMTGTPAVAMQEQKQADIENLQNLEKQTAENVRALKKSAELERLGGQYDADAMKTKGKTSLIQGGLGAFSGAVDLFSWMGALNTPKQSTGLGSSKVDYGWTQPQMNTINSYNTPKQFSFNSGLGNKAMGYQLKW